MVRYHVEATFYHVNFDSVYQIINLVTLAVRYKSLNSFLEVSGIRIRDLGVVKQGRLPLDHGNCETYCGKI